MIDRIGAYVEQYYARAQSILAIESVTLQPLTRDLGPEGFARRLVYELRVEWDPDADGPDPNVVRTLVSVNGRPPKAGDEPRCTDPRGISPEPLAPLLPGRRVNYIFTPVGQSKVQGRAAMMLDYRSVRPEPPKVEWRDECASIDLPGRTRGRIWADAESAEILRFDEHLNLGRRGVGRDSALRRAPDRSRRYPGPGAAAAAGRGALYDDRARRHVDRIPPRRLRRSGR